MFRRTNPTGLLANDLQSEGMAVRIRLSFVSIVAPLSEETGGAAVRFLKRKHRGHRGSYDSVKIEDTESKR